MAGVVKFTGSAGDGSPVVGVEVPDEGLWAYGVEIG